jgi:ATP-dependent DNA ligase
VPAGTVLDGELVIPIGGALSFEELQLRLHPAASRVRMLAAAHPALYVVFDALAIAGEDLTAEPRRVRRRALAALARRWPGRHDTLRLSPETADLREAQRWLRSGHGGLDGVIAKRSDLPYLAGTREGMVKVKQLRTLDCVVGGFRYASSGRVVGSLLLGLYDDDGLLHHVGFTSGITAAERPALTRRLEALVQPPGFTGAAPGGPSRWSTERSTEWEPLAPKLVVEVAYDHVSGGRLRHGARIVRWRPDKAARQCTFAQLRQPGRSSLRMLAP